MIKNVLILEDEKLNADRLKRLITDLRPDLKILGVLESVAEAVDWIENNDSPDLIMMDVRLADGLSFDIFEKVNIKSPIIFTTAYDEYAVRAFKFNSVDYLLKPVEKTELDAGFRKVEAQAMAAAQKSIEGLMNYFHKKDYRTRFLLPFRDGYKTVLVSEVEYFFSEQKITRAKLLNGKTEVLPQTMEELEQQLDPKLFFRANRQFIIHIDSVAQIYNYFNAKIKVVLKQSPATEIIVSREKAGVFKNWLDS
ncbi:response regulator transcription factor [Pseudoflavitalea sp. G-6-1-2]|uniref:LytR/AlgR family response regulator transcription factor n=1 Tax=Pseudoflavitalea sp. G-6-1-2 TaxID=2728841 RepID=UPI00146D994C|nr:LytTR family DNA-binding domain-containing protein [Pseudoflavitalea sp. G-6-1-2]NML20566.1 response regulator transcription factor [Pseudoflavitalea sp. G-6-1-2]